MPSPFTPKFKDVPLDERPLERCLQQGAQSLSLRECLALILGSGTRELSCLQLAARVLDRLEGAADLPPTEREIALTHSIQSLVAADLSGIPGIGPMKRAQLLATFEIARRHAGHRERTQVNTPPLRLRCDDTEIHDRTLRQIPSRLRGAAREWLGFVPWYQKSPGDLCVVDWGTRTHVNTDPAALFQRLLAIKPQGFVLFHNHPSGDPTPSPQDHRLTVEVQGLAEVFKIRLINHGVVTPRDVRWVL